MDSVINAALGKEKFDLVIQNIKLVNLFTKEIYDSEIGIKTGVISHVSHPTDEPLEGYKYYDGKGKYAIPGLIDTHIHIESTMMTPSNLSNAIVPRGTTTLACDPHEIANVMGVEGVQYMLESSEGLPLDVRVLAPSCVPAVPGLETAGADLYAKDIEVMLGWERVQGLGEIMDFEGLFSGHDRVKDIVDVGKKKDVFIQGHAPSMIGRRLSAYLNSGVESDHETSFKWEAEYKIRAGMVLECRESSIVHDMPTLVPVLKKFGYPENTTICTDDREPDDLLREGHIDHVIRTGIREGADPIELVKMATLNAAKLLRLQDRGVLMPGKRADLVLLNDLVEFEIDEVFVQGEMVSRKGSMIKRSESMVHPVEIKNTVKINRPIDEDLFKIEANGKTAVVNVIAFNPEKHIVTERQEEELPIINGSIDISNHKDLCTLAVIERHGRTDNISIAFVKNFGIEHGAVASTVAHDSHNLVVIGKNLKDMVIAANEVIEANGGIICVENGKRTGGVELPIAGLISPKPIKELAVDTHGLKNAIMHLGINTVSPIIQVAAFALPVVPEIRLTDKGLVDVHKQEFIPTIISIKK
ncbi:MAG: adenine deaminase [Vallitalea sp.]|jgi:adenine deaminase|nr:adenine deaminase [Vallitalea sp.]